jgi:hypothetical protein
MNSRALACVAFFYVLIGGLPDVSGEELTRLDLDARSIDLFEMKSANGVTLTFDRGRITAMFALPRVGLAGSAARPGTTVTSVTGLASGPQEVEESVDSLLGRLNLKPYFIALTLPDAVPIWIKASSVSFFRSVEPWDHTTAEARSVVNAGPRPYFVKETVATIRGEIEKVRQHFRRD